MALAHSIGDKVEAAYRRRDLFDKRRRMMAEWAEWAEFLARVEGGGGWRAFHSLFLRENKDKKERIWPPPPPPSTAMAPEGKAKVIPMGASGSWPRRRPRESHLRESGKLPVAQRLATMPSSLISSAAWNRPLAFLHDLADHQTCAARWRAPWSSGACARSSGRCMTLRPLTTSASKTQKATGSSPALKRGAWRLNRRRNSASPRDADL